MKILIYFVSGVSLNCLAFAIGYSLWLLIQIPARSWREMAFEYVYVNDNGSVRQLRKAEEDKLSALFVGDQLDFYIKPQYESLNPSGRLSGYLKRRHLPRGVTVGRS